jgi:SAM-dependent methyltransferase
MAYQIQKKYFWEKESLKLIFRSEILTYPFVLKLLRNLKDRNIKILDAGCGTGKLCEMLAAYNFDVYGIDLSRKAIELAKSRNAKIDYKVGNVLNLERFYKNNFFDVVVSTFVTLYLKEAQLSKFFKQVFKVLKKQGIFIIADVHPFLPIVQPKTRWEKWISKNINYFMDQEVEQFIFLPKDKDGLKAAPFKVKWIHHPLSPYFNKLIDADFNLERFYELKPNKFILQKYKKMWGEETRIPVYFVLQAKKV